MIQPTKQKVQEGHLWNDFSSSAGQFATKVRYYDSCHDYLVMI